MLMNLIWLFRWPHLSISTFFFNFHSKNFLAWKFFRDGHLLIVTVTINDPPFWKIWCHDKFIVTGQSRMVTNTWRSRTSLPTLILRRSLGLARLLFFFADNDFQTIKFWYFVFINKRSILLQYCLECDNSLSFLFYSKKKKKQIFDFLHAILKHRAKPRLLRTFTSFEHELEYLEKNFDLNL